MIHSSDEYYGKELSDEIVSKSKKSGIYIKERVSFDSTVSDVLIDKKLQAVSIFSDIQNFNECILLQFKRKLLISHSDFKRSLCIQKTTTYY